MDGFKTVRRQGINVSGGDRVVGPALTLEVGGATETVNVTAEAPLIQAQSGERSFAVIDRADREPADQPRATSPASRVDARRQTRRRHRRAARASAAPARTTS